MAEVAIIATLKALGNALASELVKRALSKTTIGFPNLETSVNKIESQLQLIQNIIKHTNLHDKSNEFQVTWINQVRNLAYEIEDIIAEFVYLIGNKHIAGTLSYVQWFFKDLKSFVALRRVASQLVKAERSIEELVEARIRWVQTTNSNSSRRSSISNLRNIVAEMTHSIPEDDIVGIEDNRIKLTNWLNSSEQELSVISIRGMGGVGKTTLVANVFKREKSHFDRYAWITISQNNTIENILRSLISEICKNGRFDKTDTTHLKVHELIKFVQDLLKDKKYLIVLDDVWNPTVFHDIKNAFTGNHQGRGSCIMITSRDNQVASLAPESSRLELEPLGKDKSKELFCRKAFRFEKNHKCPSHLVKLMEQIVEKCDGLPLAIDSLGILLSLSGQTESDWQLVHDQLTFLLEEDPNLDRVKNILNLSFIYLPRHLKNCFLYCSLFLEDSLLARKKLTRLWVAEGLVEQKGGSTLEDVAEGYLKELINRSMLQVVKRNDSGRVKRCRMHDIQRELAISLCRKENFGLINDDKNPTNIDRFSRRLSVAKLSDKIKHNICLPRLRTLMYFDPTIISSPWLSMIFKNSRYLSVLDLEGLPIEMVPNTIGDLFNLHYLSLRKTMVKLLPKSIKKLHNLQTLDLFHSQIQKLPIGMIELKKLRHLFAEVEIDNTYKSFRSRIGINLPKGMFYLKEIQTIQAVKSNSMVVRELGNLTQLRSFRIFDVKENHSTELSKSLSKMNFLSYLSINASNENEFLHLESLHLPKIQQLELLGKLRESMLNSPLFQTFGEGIQSLQLGWSQLKNDPLQSISYLRNLTFLVLTRAYEGKQLIFQVGWFPKLKSLILLQMPNLINVEMEQGTMMCLKQIVLAELNQLAEIPKGMKHLISVKRMFCADMPADFGGMAKGMHKLFHFTCFVH